MGDHIVIATNPVADVDELVDRRQFKTVKVQPLRDTTTIPSGQTMYMVDGEYKKARKHSKTPGTFYPCLKHVYIRPEPGDVRWLIEFCGVEDCHGNY